MTIDEILATIKPYRLCSQVKKSGAREVWCAE